MKTILATAYAVNPYNGSEDGMGWNYIYQIARFHKVIAVTRENNWVQIEKYMAENPDKVYNNIRFVYFDLPYYLRFWKKGKRGALLYYLIWQRALPGFIKKQNLEFDITHNLNFHNDWTPSYLWKLNKPFVWGHVGHHPQIPSECLKQYGMNYWLKEKATWLIKQSFWKFSPGLKKTVANSKHILCMNTEVPKYLNLQKTRFTISPSVATMDFGYHERVKTKKFTVISAGRLIPLKGFDLAIRAFAHFLSKRNAAERANCEFLIVGKGPELKTYQKMVQQLNIVAYVKFIPWMERKELMTLFGQASVFLFPSHEGAGMVVAEALSFGLPVICLDNSGPGEYITPDCGYAIPYTNYNQTITTLAYSITKLFENPPLQKYMSQKARARFKEKFEWNLRGEEFKNTYSKL